MKKVVKTHDSTTSLATSKMTEQSMEQQNRMPEEAREGCCSGCVIF